jgi:hypothetical protein
LGPPTTCWRWPEWLARDGPINPALTAAFELALADLIDRTLALLWTVEGRG